MNYGIQLRYTKSLRVQELAFDAIPTGGVETDPWMRRSHESLPFTFCKCNLTMGLTARDWNAGFDIIHTQCVCQCHCSNPSDHPSAKFFSAKYVLNSWAGE
jgi:hypothetical protein